MPIQAIECNVPESATLDDTVAELWAISKRQHTALLVCNFSNGYTE